jgi:hypothetical protein
MDAMYTNVAIVRVGNMKIPKTPMKRREEVELMELTREPKTDN